MVNFTLISLKFKVGDEHFAHLYFRFA